MSIYVRKILLSSVHVCHFYCKMFMGLTFLLDTMYYLRIHKTPDSVEVRCRVLLLAHVCAMFIEVNNVVVVVANKFRNVVGRGHVTHRNT